MFKLMVVDDEPDICDFMQSFFKERKFKVLTAHNGGEALNLMLSERPHIILLDHLIPGMNGIEILKRVKKMDNNVKVIMITTLDDKDNAADAARNGAAGYMIKPLLLEQLERTVFMLAEQLRAAGQVLVQ